MKSVTVELKQQITRTNVDEEKKTRSQVKHASVKKIKKQSSILFWLRFHNTKEGFKRTAKKESPTGWPLKYHGFDLTKQEFRHAIRMRYGWARDRLPTLCVCGARFDVPHALSCKRGGYFTLRHNEVRNITANLLRDIYTDVKIKPMLAKVERAYSRENRNGGRESRLVRALNFWVTGLTSIFWHNCFWPFRSEMQEPRVDNVLRKEWNWKKRQYKERLLEVEHGSFTPLVFSSNGGMGRECFTFYKRLSETFAEKNKQPIYWQQTRSEQNYRFSSVVNKSLHLWVQITKADNWKFGINSKDQFDQ